MYQPALVISILSLFSCLFATLMFVQASPLIMVALLILMSLFTALNSGVLITHWFFYTILIFYLGGMMIMFIYIASLSTLKEFKMTFSFILLAVVFCFFVKEPMQSMHMTQVSFFYNSFSCFFPISMAIILLIALFTVTLLANNWSGPLKSKLYE